MSKHSKAYVPQKLIRQAETIGAELLQGHQSALVFLIRYAHRRGPSADDVRRFLNENMATARRAVSASRSKSKEAMELVTLRLDEAEWHWIHHLSNLLTEAIGLEREKVSLAETVRSILRWSIRNWPPPSPDD